MEKCLLCNLFIFDSRSHYVLDCEHDFHTRCLVNFIIQHQNRCPVCNKSLTSFDRRFFRSALRGLIGIIDDENDSGYDSN